MDNLIPSERIERRIYLIRGEKVMLDSDLAELYGVPTKRLNEQVRRNLRRFPKDFMFQLSSAESANLRSQFATSSSDWGGRRYTPSVFTELGVAMLSSVLNSERAISVNIVIMRTFVRLRRLLASNQDLARKLGELDKKCSRRFRLVFEALEELMAPSEDPRPKIGFQP